MPSLVLLAALLFLVFEEAVVAFDYTMPGASKFMPTRASASLRLLTTLIVFTEAPPNFLAAPALLVATIEDCKWVASLMP